MRQDSIPTTICAVILVGFGTVAITQPVQAQGSGPCAQIKAVCEQAGFKPGGAKEGVGLVVDCIRPIVEDKPQRPKAVKPLPQIDPQLVAACKSKNPKFGQPKDKPAQVPKPQEPASPGGEPPGKPPSEPR